MRKTFAEINLNNLKFNFLNIREKVNGRKMLAVVKADAYGHGMIECVAALESLGNKRPHYYGVALLEEGIQLRKSKLTKSPILCFAPFLPEESADYFKFDIIPTVSSLRDINNLKRTVLRKKLKVHINIDTGMGRTGIRFDEALPAIKRLNSIKNIIIDGVYTHFATSDEKDKSYSKLQLNRFKEVIASLTETGISTGVIHAANSGAILDMDDSYFDMVRPGISLYGYYPSQQTSESVKLKPVMSVVSRVLEIRKIYSGESVSYGRKFIAETDTIVFSVPIGYADGYSRNLTNKSIGIVRNRPMKQIGTVSMDRIIFDTQGANVRVNDKIILLGKSKDYKFDAWDWANLLNTIPYEITCGIGKRVPRIYIG